MWGPFWFILHPFWMHRGILDHLVSKKEEDKDEDVKGEDRT